MGAYVVALCTDGIVDQAPRPHLVGEVVETVELLSCAGIDLDESVSGLKYPRQQQRASGWLQTSATDEFTDLEDLHRQPQSLMPCCTSGWLRVSRRRRGPLRQLGDDKFSIIWTKQSWFS